MIAQYFAPDEFDGFTRAPYKPLFLWGQSVFIIAQLLTAGLLHINELDMIRRYLPSYNRPRKGGRYSAFQVSVDAAEMGMRHFCRVWEVMKIRLRVLFFIFSLTN